MQISQKYLAYDRITCGAGDFTPYTVKGIRDLSAVNRKGLSATTKKGVPLLAKYAVTITPSMYHEETSDPDGNSLYKPPALQADISKNVVMVRFYGAPNNWVTRNACVKIHNAREAFLKSQGIKKSERGAYDHTIRYKYRASENNVLTPVNGELDLQLDPSGVPYADEALTYRAPINGGTWDYTDLIFADDPSGATLHLVGGHASEDGTPNFQSLCAGQLYLSSRGTIDSDSNREQEDSPSEDSILQKMMNPVGEGLRDEVRVDVRDSADNPPYDLSITNNDAYEAVEIGRLSFVVGQASSATAIIEAPLGQFEARFAACTVAGTASASGNVEMTVELLGLSEM